MIKKRTKKIITTTLMVMVPLAPVIVTHLLHASLVKEMDSFIDKVQLNDKAELQIHLPNRQKLKLVNTAIIHQENQDAKAKKEDLLSFLPNDSQHEYPFTFSACLMLKDDNQILPEWIAYHYTFLPLRQLIIAADPLSLTRVETVVEPFRSIGMKIKVYNGNEYYVDGRWWKEKFENFDRFNHSERHGYDFLMYRQNSFYARCSRILNKQGYKHTIVLDSDEFLTFNDEWNKTLYYEWALRNTNESIPSVDMVPDVPSYVGRQNETLAHWIERGADPLLSYLQSEEHEGCVILPRLLVSPQESTLDEIYSFVEDGFNASYYNTLLFQRRGLLRTKSEQIGKSIVNLEHYHWSFPTNPHRLFQNCYTHTGTRLPKAGNPQAFSLHVHHNVGSYELWANLNPHRYRGKYEDRIKSLHGPGKTVRDTTKTGWLRQFIKLVGKEKAFELTQSLRTNASVEEKAITERLRRNETVPFVYDWTEPIAEPVDDEGWRAISFD